MLFGCNPKGDVKPSTEDEKTFYSVGVLFGERMKSFNLNDKEIQMMSQGLKDAAQNKELAANPEQYRMKVQQLFMKRAKEASEKVKKAGTEYMDKFLKDGGKKTSTGLAYKIVKEGSKKKPKATDKVEVHYEGKLIDGTVFDSSIKRGEKVKFPLNRVIKGWTEGLQLIGEGGKIQLVVPADLGYGDQGAPPKIPGGATLVFDVELFAVLPNDAPKDKMHGVKVNPKKK